MRAKYDRAGRVAPREMDDPLAQELEARGAFGPAYRVLVADDHPVVRRGILALLSTQPGIEVCGEACDGAQAIEMTRSGKPNLLLLDLTLPEKNGIEVLQAVREESPETDVLILSMHFSEELARQVLRHGALGYVLKSDADAELLAAVDHMRHRQPFFTNRLAISMAQNFMQLSEAGAGNENGPDPGVELTERELEVVRLLAAGKSNKEVAAEMGVSTRTIESHRTHIMRKMRFASFSDLVRYAIRNSLIDP